MESRRTLTQQKSRSKSSSAVLPRVLSLTFAKEPRHSVTVYALVRSLSRAMAHRVVCVQRGKQTPKFKCNCESSLFHPFSECLHILSVKTRLQKMSRRVSAAVAVLFALLTVSSAAFAQAPKAQEPNKPTVNQCRSYYMVWQPPNPNTIAGEGLSGIVALQTRDVKLTNDDLWTRVETMGACEVLTVSYEHGHEGEETQESLRYARLGAYYMAVQGMRYEYFIRRHNLNQRFIEEDAAEIKAAK